MLVRCGDVDREGRELIVSIVRYVHTGSFQQAIEIFDHMKAEDLTSHAFVALFGGCAELKDGTLASKLFSKFSASKHTDNEHAINACISMFSKCGNLVEAEKVSINNNNLIMFKNTITKKPQKS